MSPKGSGNGRTPPRVSELLKKAVAESNQVSVAKAVGIARLALQNYLKGESEPTTATLEKISKWSGRSIGYLRGDAEAQFRKTIKDYNDKAKPNYYLKISREMIQAHKVLPDNLKYLLEPAIADMYEEIMEFMRIKHDDMEDNICNELWKAQDDLEELSRFSTLIRSWSQKKEEP